MYSDDHTNSARTGDNEQGMPPVLTEDEKIDIVAAQVLQRYWAAFEELAK